MFCKLAQNSIKAMF
ncbi:hypothetical protein PPV52_003363 [Escherichia coli O103]|nr:hypothetical protein [Escherichia coli]EKK9165732.1 hypothetical protein [Escherichia coli O103]EHJ8011975.1 hypothetical protein [Escherichia coli]EHP5105752.1 hypothetical protein [Escherichia coli]EHT4049840.1 hypothetical protein [Escherichia coli]EID7189865.1 hypothetical protein [Escherichia coli]